MIIDDRIVLWAPYGQHIPLKCEKCGATGSTKNIDFIGARSIFVDCTCPSKFLKVVAPENADVLEKLEIEKMAESERVNKFVRERVTSLINVAKMFPCGSKDRVDKIRAFRDNERSKAIDEYNKDKK